jgi:ferredoxin
MIIQSVTLLYFSPTGTTRRILEAIAEGLDVGKTEHIDLTPPSAKTVGVKHIYGDLTLIGVPVYTGRVAMEAVERLKQIAAQKSPAIIVVVYGNREYEDAFIELKDIALGQGFKPIAGGTFIGEHSFSTVSVPIAQGRPDNKDLDCARSFGTLVKQKIDNAESLHNLTSISVPGNIPYRERGPARHTSPETSEALCIRCRKCAEVCPVAAISVHESGVRTDRAKCILCCSCVKNCPTGARRLEDQPLTKFIQEKLSAMCTKRKEPEMYL